MGKKKIWVREGLKKKKKKKTPEFSVKVSGWGQHRTNFPFFLFKKKDRSLRHLKLPKNHFKTNLFFLIFGGGDPPPVISWSDGRLELQTSLEKPSDTSLMTRIIQNSLHGM